MNTLALILIGVSIAGICRVVYLMALADIEDERKRNRRD